MPALEWASPNICHPHNDDLSNVSPKNSIGTDLEELIKNPDLDLAALTVFDRNNIVAPPINP